MLNRNLTPIPLFSLLWLTACQTLPPSQTPPPAPNAQVTEAAKPAKPPPVAQPVPAKKLSLKSHQAMQSVKAGDIDKAIEQYKRIVASDPDTTHAWTNLGLLYLHRNEMTQARHAFEQAIAVDNQDAVAFNNLAIIQRHNGEFKKALFNYYKAINIQPDYANAHLNLGILLDIYLQDLPKALEQYEIYQQLTGGQDEKVKKWIIDITRRIDASGKK